MNAQDNQGLPPYLSAMQVAEYLGISKSSVYALIHSEDFPCVNINRRILIPRDHFLSYMDNLLTEQKGAHNGKTQS